MYPPTKKAKTKPIVPIYGYNLRGLVGEATVENQVSIELMKVKVLYAISQTKYHMNF